MSKIYRCKDKDCPHSCAIEYIYGKPEPPNGCLYSLGFEWEEIKEEEVDNV